MSETIILAIIVCSCIAVVALIITIGVLIYNYQDNTNFGFSYQSLQTDVDLLDKRVELLETKIEKGG